MIRICKCIDAPASLAETKAYDGEDVKRQLLRDQHGKCYICERIRDTDFEVEHFQSQENHEALKQAWTNLLMACSYCNRKKLHHFDHLLNPLEVNIEEVIEQRLDYDQKKALFQSHRADEASVETVRLLQRVFNGTHRMRTLKEERFFESAMSAMNRFLELVNAYLWNPDATNEKAVRDELAIDKEFLGLKYWIIQDNEALKQTFAKDIIWNKK